MKAREPLDESAASDCDLSLPYKNFYIYTFAKVYLFSSYYFRTFTSFREIYFDISL